MNVTWEKLIKFSKSRHSIFKFMYCLFILFNINFRFNP